MFSKQPNSLLFLSSASAYPGVPHAGGVTIWQTLSVLAKSHAVSLVAFEKPDEISKREAIRASIDRYITVPAFRGWLSRLIRLPLLLIMPLDLVSILSLSFFLKFRRALRAAPPAIVQAEYSSMGIYLWTVPSDTVTVLNLHDIQTDVLEQAHRHANGLRRVVLHTQKTLMEWWEKRTCQKVSMILVWSEKDREFVSSRWHIPESKIHIFSPYVDFSMENIPPGDSDGGTLLFVGAMYREVNIEGCEWFLEKIWPLIKAKHPDAVFRIIGGNPPKHFVERWRKLEDVRITGYVPDLSSEYRRATVVVVPLLRAGGIIVKMLDAFVAARPLVATPAANSGIKAEDSAVRIAKDPLTFAEHVIKLLDSPKMCQELGVRGREFVRRRYRWQTTIRDLENAYTAANERLSNPPGP